LRGAAQTITAVTGADPAPLFRFPFGDRTAVAPALTIARAPQPPGASTAPGSD
jgi:hypothetical protein